MSNEKCKFCNSTEIKIENQLTVSTLYDCSICGKYILPPGIDQSNVLENKLLKSKVLQVHLVAENINTNKDGLIPFWKMSRLPDDKTDEKYTPKYLEDYEDLPISHEGKIEGILKIIALKTYAVGPFDPVNIDAKEMYALKIKDSDELKIWVKSLQEFVKDESGMFPYFSLTPNGWAKVNSLFSNVHSRKVFIAMAFSDNPERPEIQNAIRLACKNADWETPFTIDEKEYSSGVSDKIISEIKQSKFIVADFTYNNHGVYYEAGLAAGRNIPVIYTVKETQKKQDGQLDIHFDIRHLNFIVWKDYEDLTKKLTNRIKAIIN